jgi:dTMP kinase
MNDNRPMKGRFFVIEGLDGAGKATQVRLLAKKLRAKGQKVTIFSFPNYESSFGSFIRDTLAGKHGDIKAVDTYYRSIPYAVDRLLVRDKIIAALKKGVVLSDRYTTSNLAFGAASCAPVGRASYQKFFEELEYGSFKLPKPHRVIYLQVPVSVSRKWLTKERKGKLDSNERDMQFQEAVEAEYGKLAKRKEWRTIACKEGESPEDIGRKVEAALR